MQASLGFDNVMVSTLFVCSVFSVSFDATHDGRPSMMAGRHQFLQSRGSSLLFFVCSVLLCSVLLCSVLLLGYKYSMFTLISIGTAASYHNAICYWNSLRSIVFTHCDRPTRGRERRTRSTGGGGTRRRASRPAPGRGASRRRCSSGAGRAPASRSPTPSRPARSLQ